MTQSQVTSDKQSYWKQKVSSIIGLNARRLPALAVAFVIAEFFFKFGSFSLECVAFLALWRVLDLVVERVAHDNN